MPMPSGTPFSWGTGLLAAAPFVLSLPERKIAAHAMLGAIVSSHFSRLHGYLTANIQPG